MDYTEVIKFLFDAPLALLLFWFLIQEQRQHTETRAKRDDDMRRYLDSYAVLVDRVAKAVERLDLPGPL